ncbi:MAG: PKD domain-containing protein [Thermoplasmatota archaeon]
MQRTAAFSLVLLLVISGVAGIFLFGQTSVDGIPTRLTVIGNEKNSTGLMQSASFTTVETWDADKDGNYEIYLGGAGRTNPRTRGISAYEYVVSNSTWVSFGSGLPGPGSGEYYGALGLGDVNKDGNLDIVAPIPSMWYATSTNAVEIWTSNSNNAFTKAHTFSPGKSTNEAEVADLDGDNNPDIIFSYYGGLKAYFGSGSATSWTESSPTANNYEMDGVAAGDLNHDGLLDLVATPYAGTRKVYMYIQGSSRSWSEVTFKNTANEAYGIKIADLNGDGDNDVIYGSRGEGIKVWCGNGGGSTGGTSFTWTSNSSGLPTSTGDWNQVELGDVDQDGDLDVIAISSGQDRARIFINNQPNSWTELFTQSNQYLTIGGSGYGANFVDFDGDGDLDAVGCSWGGGVDAYTIHTSGTPPPPPPNKRPVADAGDDQEVMLGEAVDLDGTGSRDPENATSGDPTGTILFYDWNVTLYPAGSQIRDSSLTPSENSATPSFTPDKVGTYSLSLRVRDPDDEWSLVEDTINIVVLKPNDPPVADAGPDQSGRVGDTFTLDGSASSDPDGAITAYEWKCTSHSVYFTGQGTVTASFKATKPETYVITLRVYDNNNTWSDPDELLVQVAENWQNIPPTANAGPDQEVLLGSQVTLDGSKSRDPDGTILEWEWTSTSHPSLVFQNANSSSPVFTPADASDHIIRLRVRDSNNTWSSADTVIIYVDEPYVNVVPVANAGPDQEVEVGEQVTLDGRDSYDTDGFIVSYNWTCTSHTVELMSPQSSTPSFVPASAGEYVFTLSVSDDESAWSPEDTVEITVTEPPVVPTYDITLGPFRYEDGTVASGGTVVLIKGEDSWTADTDSEGKVSFLDLLAGTYKCKVLVDGKDSTSLFDVTIEEGGSVSIPGGLPSVYKDVEPQPDDDDDDDDIIPADDDTSEKGSAAGIIIAVVIVVVLFLAAGAVGVFFYMRTQEEDQDEETGGEKECPKCSTPMEHNEDFNTYKCPKCGRYER